MIENGGVFRCDHCKEIIPGAMLWVEVTGSYKSKAGAKDSYKSFRWDFCDLFCLKDFLNNRDLSDIEISSFKEGIERRKKEAKAGDI